MKLIYFDVKGLAETIRYIFAYKGIEYEDFRYPLEIIDPVNHKYNRVQFEIDRANGLFDKSMGKLPILVLDSGQQLCQSKAIERYLAKKFNLMGSNEYEEAKIDSICECIRDIKDQYYMAKHKEAFDSNEYFTKVLPSKLFDLTKMMADKNVIPKYSVGSSESLADIVLYHFLTDFFSKTDQEHVNIIINKSIRLKAIVSNMRKNELLNGYLEKRPERHF